MGNLLLRTWMFLRRNLWHRSLEEIHVEAAYSYDAFKKLCQYARLHPETYLMLTCPTQDLWQRLRIQAEKADEEFYEMSVSTRYECLMKEVTSSLGVHVHLFGPYSVNIPSYQEQYALIKEAKDYFDKLGLPTYDFATGWNRYNADTIHACEELGFKRFHISQVKLGCEKSEKLKFVMVYNVGHDWSLK